MEGVRLGQVIGHNGNATESANRWKRNERTLMTANGVNSREKRRILLQSGSVWRKKGWMRCICAAKIHCVLQINMTDKDAAKKCSSQHQWPSFH